MFGTFFGSKPLPPLVGEIEAATNSPLSQPDEAAFLEICDHINQDKNGPATALTVLISQLEQFAARDPKSAAFTLALLDFCVKNGGYRFTSELCKGNYLQKLKKLVDRQDIAVGIRNRLLTLIKVWAQAFSNHVDFQPVNALYRELLRNAVHFPDVDINDVDLLKRAIPSPNILETPRLTQQPTAPNVRTLHLMGAIRNDLRLTYLDLPAFEALLQGLACNPPDSVTLRQLQTTADRLEGLQRRLEAYIVPLSESIDPKSQSAQEEEAMLDELIRVNEQIRDDIQQFQSFVKMRCREEESQKAARSISGPAASEAATTVVKPPSAPKPLPEAVAPSPATTSAVNARPSIQRTLFQAREAIQQFRTFQQEKRTSSAQMVNAAQMDHLRVLVERLEDFQKKVSGLINDFLNGNSTGIIEEDELVLANLTAVNDELLRCIKTYQRTAQRGETRRETTEPLSSAEATTAIGAGVIQSTKTPTASSSASPPLLSPTSSSPSLSSTTTATTSSISSASTSSLSPSSSSSSTTTASSSTTTTSTTTTSTPTEASSSHAIPAAGTHLAEAQQCLRKNIQFTLDQAMETLARFAELLQGCVERPLQPADPTRVAEFQHVGDRLVVLQKKIPPLIKSWSEILGEDSVNVLEGDETILDTLTRVNDELLLGIEKYQQAVERLHDEPGAVTGGQVSTTAGDAASGTGAAPRSGHAAFDGVAEAAQTANVGQSAFVDTHLADQFSTLATQDSTANEVSDLRKAVAPIPNTEFVTLPDESRRLGSQITPQMMAQMQSGAAAGGQEWTTANGPASGTSTVPGSGHAAFEAVAEAARSVTFGQSTFPDAQLTDERGGAGRQEWTTTNGPANVTSTVPGRGQTAFGAVAEAAQTANVGQSTAFVDTHLADQSGATAGGQEWTTANGPASRTGTVPGSGHAAFEAVVEAAQSVTSGQSTFPDAQLTDQRGGAGRQEWTTTNGPASVTSTVPGRGQTAFEAVAEAAQTANVGQSTAFVDTHLADQSEKEIHPEGTPTEAPARVPGTVVSEGFVASNAPESTMEAPQNSIYDNFPHRLSPSADLQLIDLSGATAGGQEWTTANGPASRTGTVPGSGHAAFEAVAEAAQSVTSGQSTFPDAQLTDQRGGAGRQEWTTTNGPASVTSTVPGRGQTAFEAVAETAQTANVGQSAAFVDTHLADQSEKEIHPERTPTEYPARDPGTVVSEGFVASNAPESIAEAPQNSIYDNFPHRLSPSDDIQLIDLSEEEIHPEGTPTEDSARDTGNVVSKGFLASNAPESTVEAPQNSIYNNSPHRLPPSADLQLIDLVAAAPGIFSGSVLSVDGRDNRWQAADTRPPPSARTGAAPVQLQ
ncbi:TOM1-like protein 2 [Sparganum proliferum]